MAARMNPNQPPSKSDRDTFYHMRAEEKARVLYTYLYERNNMENTAYKVYGTADMAKTQDVSTIMRCCGFSGQNSGHYIRLNLTLDDFLDFAEQYPRGCPREWPDHRTIDEFMWERDRINSDPQLQQEQMWDRQQRQEQMWDRQQRQEQMWDRQQQQEQMWGRQQQQEQMWDRQQRQEQMWDRQQRQEQMWDRQVQQGAEKGREALKKIGGGIGDGIGKFSKSLKKETVQSGAERREQGYTGQDFRRVLGSVLLAAVVLFFLIDMRVGPFGAMAKYYSKGIPGLFQVCSMVTFYSPIFYLIFQIIKKRFRRGIGIALPIFWLSWFFANLAKNDMDNALIDMAISAVLYAVGKWFANRKS